MATIATPSRAFRIVDGITMRPVASGFWRPLVPVLTLADLLLFNGESPANLVANFAEFGPISKSAVGARNGLESVECGWERPIQVLGEIRRRSQASCHPTTSKYGCVPLAMLESGEAKSLKEIAARERIDNSDVIRMVKLSTLAPDIAAGILDDTLPNHVTLFDLAVDPPALWDEQRERLIDPAAESQ